MENQIIQNILELLEDKKINVFTTFQSQEIAMENALLTLPEVDSNRVKTAILSYHNTLLNELQKEIGSVECHQH